MPTIKENKTIWDGEYRWSGRGDEWSDAWGGPSMQWQGAVLPRIRPYVPARRILEIGCGFGRWTQYLKDLCENLTVIDLSEECIRACKQRFSECSHIDYFVNDGMSLDMVSDSSVDFVFTLDSLVHADDSAVKAYIGHLKRILTAEGVAFIHHSNLCEYRFRSPIVRRIPKLERLLTMVVNLEPNLHMRDFSVDAKKVVAWAEENELRCISQEIIPWGTRRMLIDCISIIVKRNSSLARDNRIVRNARFMQEAQELRLSSGDSQKP